MNKEIILQTQFDFGANKNRFNAIVYRATIPTNNWLICLHGQGEIGPSDGSQLSKVTNLGYPRLAETGYEFPFNIIAPQVASDYYEIDKWFPSYVKTILGADRIGVTGLSLGGRGTYSMLNYDRHNHIDFIVSVCGAAQVNDAFTMRDIAGLAFHGDKDTTSGVAFSTNKGFVNAYNSFPGRIGRIEFISIPGAGHSIWGYCYDPANALYGQVAYNFIIDGFSQPLAEPTVLARPEMIVIEEYKQKIKDALILRESSFIDNIV